MQPPANESLIDSYFTMVKSDAYEHFGDLITDDCTFAVMPIGHIFRGRDQIMAFVMSAGGARRHDARSQVHITNWFRTDGYLCVEYEHQTIIRLLRYRTKIDGYCLIFRIRDGRFDAIREYINPSGAAMAFMITYALRLLPLAATLRTGRQRRRDPQAGLV